MASARDSVIAKITATANKTQSARERKQKKGNATGYVSIWNDAVMDEFGKEHCVAPTIKMAGMLKKSLTRLPNQNPTHIKLFIDWAVTTWKDHSDLTKKGKWPEFPDIPIFVWTVDKLYLAYCRKDQTKIRLKPSKEKPDAVDKTAEKLTAENKRLATELAKAQEENRKLLQRIRLLTDK